MHKFMSFLKKVVKENWAYILSIVFFWVIPIIMLNETVALTETNVSFKLTFMGCLVILFVVLALRKKLYVFIEKRPHGMLRATLLCLYKMITYGTILGVFWAISSFGDKFFKWWLLSGVSIFFGLIFIIINEKIKTPKKEVKDENESD